MMLLSIILSFIGFMHLSMTINTHYECVYDDDVSSKSKKVFHLFGWSFLFASIFPCFEIWNTGIAGTVWVGILHLSAVLVVTSLSYSQVTFNILWKGICIGSWFEFLTKK